MIPTRDPVTLSKGEVAIWIIGWPRTLNVRVRQGTLSTLLMHYGWTMSDLRWKSAHMHVRFRVVSHLQLMPQKEHGDLRGFTIGR